MRPKHFVSVSLLSASLMLVGAGCGGSKTPGANAPVSSNANTGTNIATSDNCGNPYYPFKPGLTIAYKVTPVGNTAESSDFTTRILSVVGTTASVRTELAGGATADMEADCASGSVALKGSSGLGAEVQGVKFKTTVVSSSGTSMPANVVAGTVWNHSETIRMEITDGPAGMGPITLTTSERSKAISEESVTVPAGTFTAIKVELTRTTTSTLSGVTGAKVQELPPTTSKSTEWWVKGIGMVKTVTVDKDGTSTIEAKSVTGR